MGPSPAATAAAAPPLEPPGVRSRSQGLRVRPKSGLSVSALWPNSEVLVLPRMTAPAARRRPDRDGVFFRDQVGEEPGAAGGAQAARVEHVLQRHRYSVEWTERLALHHRDLRLAGHDAGEVGRHQAIGIETRVELLDTSEQRSGQLDGGQLLVADQRGDLERRPPGEILVNQGTLLGTDRHCIIRLVGEVAGAEILRDARGRRIGERDRWGGDVAHLTWTRDGALGEAAVRLPDGAWLFIHPGAARDARWGPSDVLRLDDSEAPLTHFASVNWAAIDAIPPLAEPARLPPARAPRC